MRRVLVVGLLVGGLLQGSVASAEHPKVGGYEQFAPGPLSDQDVRVEWSHRSMTFGMMHMMSGMTSQVAQIMRTGRATPEMEKKLADVLDHIAKMLNDAPAYMVGTSIVDSDMVTMMHDMLKDLEQMRKDTGLR
jgi:hypothetical protein